jgi:hypothetical protein
MGAEKKKASITITKATIATSAMFCTPTESLLVIILPQKE